ncbi:MAG: glutathione S-transferase family protein [Pseudomonadota bacterium]
MALKLIHFPNTRSLRVVWAIEELGLDAEIDTRVFDRPSLKEPEYLALNPLGKTPVFFDGDKRLIESTAIIQYLADVYGGGALSRKPGDDDYGEFLQWLHFGEAGMGGYVNMLIAQTALLPEDQRIPSMKVWAEKETANCLAFLEGALEDREYLLGAFSLADISVAYLLFLIKITRNGGLFGDGVRAYFKRITDRKGWQKAMAYQP